MSYIGRNTVCVPWWDSLGMINHFWMYEQKQCYKTNEFKVTYNNSRQACIDFYTAADERMVYRLQQLYRARSVLRRVLAYYRGQPGSLLREALLLLTRLGTDSLFPYDEHPEEYAYALDYVATMGYSSLRRAEGRARFALPPLMGGEEPCPPAC